MEKEIAVMKPVSWVKRSPLLAYFILVFGIEWALFLLLSSSMPPLIALMVGSWLPNCVGVLVTGVALGRKGLGNLFRTVILWRVHFRWYAAALLLPITASLLAISLSLAWGDEPPSFIHLYQLPTVFLGALFTGAMGEELGWRGTALPLLQRRWNPLQSSLILGILWGLYHLPSFLLSGLPLVDAPIIPFMLAAIAITVLVTWTFNQTSGSLLLVFLYHFSFNFIGNATGIFSNEGLMVRLSIILLIMSAIVVALNRFRFTLPRASRLIELR